jgi:GT2 family glycosyltransferase
MKTLQALTVCVPTVNRPAELAVALASVLGQTVHPYRVLIALDGNAEQQAGISGDGLIGNLRLALKADGVQVDFASNTGPHGIGQIKNFYLDLIESPWFLQLEDDAWLSPDYIERLINAPCFRRDSTGGVAGVQLLPTLPRRAGWSDHDLRPQRTAPRVFNGLRITPERVEYTNKGQVYRYGAGVLRTRQEIPAQCFLHTYCLRTDAVRAIGGWDLQFSNPERSFAFEEVDTSYGLWMSGYELFVVPSAVMWHFRSTNRCLPWRYDAHKVRAGYEHHERLFINKWLPRRKNK